MRGDPHHYPIPPDPIEAYCEVEYQVDGIWRDCGEYANEVVADTLMCQEHITDHYASERADDDRKRMKGE